MRLDLVEHQLQEIDFEALDFRIHGFHTRVVFELLLRSGKRIYPAFYSGWEMFETFLATEVCDERTHVFIDFAKIEKLYISTEVD